MKTAFSNDLKNYALILLGCVLVTALAFILRPHDCKTTYGPPPYHYNTDLTLWVQLAEKPVAGLSQSILANRPLFAYLGWALSQPLKPFLGEQAISSPTRAGGSASVPVATIGGLFLANSLCFLLSGLLLYQFTWLLFGSKSQALLSSLLWITSSYAYAWSYHPVNQMGGMVVIFSFSLFLWLTVQRSSFWRHALFGLEMGILLLMKAYYVLPFIYLIWCITKRLPFPHIIAGFSLFFLPTIAWQRLYELITGAQFVDYHLGAGGIWGFLSEQIFTIAGLSQLISQIITNLPRLPLGILPAAGLPVFIAAIAFYSQRRIASLNRDYSTFALLYTLLFFVFLTMSGFLIPRHGSDFFPLIYPAAAHFSWQFFTNTKSKKMRYALAAFYILYTLASYTNTWLCAAQIL